MYYVDVVPPPVKSTLFGVLSMWTHYMAAFTQEEGHTGVWFHFDPSVFSGARLFIISRKIQVFISFFPRSIVR